MAEYQNGEAEIGGIKNAEPSEKKKGCKLLIYDIKQRKLIPIKILTFLTFAGYGVLLPYMPVHMKSLGMDIEEIGGVYAASSFCIVVGPICAGLIADKLGNFKVLLCSLHGLAGLTALLLMLIPVGRLTIDYPANVSLVISCSDRSFGSSSIDGLVMTVSDSSPCDLAQSANLMATNLSVTIESCDNACDGNTSATIGLDTYSNIPVANVSLVVGSGINKTYPVLKISKDPVDGKGQELMDSLECHRSELIGSSGSQSKSAYCRCVASTPRSNLCSNTASQQILNPRLTFWLYISVRLVFDSLIAGGGTLFEGASLSLVQELQCDYGLQKMFGFIGIAISSPTSGILIDYFTVDKNMPSFGPAFYIFAGLFCTAALGMLAVDLKFKLPAKYLTKDMKSVFKNIELDILIIFSFISGALLGGTANFIFLFLEEIGSSKSLMGFSLMVACLTSIPILLFSNFFFSNFGHPNVLVGCMAVYVIRLLGYSFLTDPSWCLLLESIEAITGTLTAASILTYAAQLGTKTTLASIQGIMAATYYGLGGGVVGSYITSFIIKAYGQRLTFRILGLVAFITGFTFFLFNVFYIRRKNLAKKREIETAPSTCVEQLE